MFRDLVISNRIISMDYFLDKMTFEEVALVYDNISYSHRNEWEIARILRVSILSLFSKKPLQPKDVLSFPWDKESEYDNAPITPEDKERVRALSAKIANKLNHINE